MCLITKYIECSRLTECLHVLTVDRFNSIVLPWFDVMLINLTIEKASFVLASPERTLTTVERSKEQSIDWRVCFVYGINEPKSRKGFHAGDPETYGTYRTISNCLKEWWEAECLTVELRQKVLNLNSELLGLLVNQALQRALVENKAIFHKKCITKYGNEQLKWMREEPTATEMQTPKKSRSFAASNFVSRCFFCEKANGTQLIPCRTDNLNKHVGRISVGSKTFSKAE